MSNIIIATSSELREAELITNEQSACDVDLTEVPRMLLALKRDEVIDAYCKVLNRTPEELAEFEFGIDSWIGFGSVTCCEIGGGTLVGYGFDEIQMVVL